jgi:diguanylate cyclase (GGDEF)-like protein/putative nucleotidyltransferase with HDIG domain
MRMKNRFTSLNFKVKFALVTVAAVPLLLGLVVNSYLVTRNFSNIEKRSIEYRTNQAKVVLNTKASGMSRMAKDYGIWDEAYTSIEDGRIEWIKENFSDFLPENQGVDIIAVLDKKGRIVNSFGLSKQAENAIKNDSNTIELLGGKYDENLVEYPHGLKVIDESLYLIGTSPIITVKYDKPSNGAIILGRKVDEDLLDEIENEFGYNVSIFFNEKIISRDAHLKRAEVFFKQNKVMGDKRDIIIQKDKALGGESLEDINENVIGQILIDEPREIFTTTFRIVINNALMVFSLSALVIFLLTLYLRKKIISPIDCFKVEIAKMVKANKLSPVKIEGPDEIIDLAETFNWMTTALIEHKEENESLKTLTITDGLTNLYNHRYFYEYFEEKTKNKNTNLAILFCDIDNFKVINDTHGHLIGDFILKKIGEIIKDEVSEVDGIFRYGGEEFVLLFEEVSKEKAFSIAESIRIKISKAKEIQKYAKFFPVTISIGIASYPEDSLNAEVLVERADAAMYHAKQKGRNQCQFYTHNLENHIMKDSEEHGKREMILNSVYALTAAIDAKDTYTEKHSELVAKYALNLAEKVNLTDSEKYSIRIGGLLHDCGKIGVPDDIIHKNGKLTEDEFGTIKNHTLLGSNIIKYIISTPEIESCVRYHHERWDGKGYPDGLSGTSIPLCARIICIADSYHAMTSDRPYRKALDRDEAFDQLRKNKGTQFDPNLVDEFIESILENEELAA